MEYDRKDSSGTPNHPPEIERSASSSSSSVGYPDETQIHAPIPTRPRLPSRTSSGPLVVPRNSSNVGPVETNFGPNDVRAMSPRRTSEDIETLGREAREELQRSVISQSLLRPVIAGNDLTLPQTFRHANPRPIDMPKHFKIRYLPSSIESRL
jgi:short coiled-coil protein